MTTHKRYYKLERIERTKIKLQNALPEPVNRGPSSLIRAQGSAPEPDPGNRRQRNEGRKEKIRREGAKRRCRCRIVGGNAVTAGHE
eukprot:scaffold190983_cov30-Tisochrysis_lutea.AAC.2